MSPDSQVYVNKGVIGSDGFRGALGILDLEGFKTFGFDSLSNLVGEKLKWQSMFFLGCSLNGDLTGFGSGEPIL